jgi:hypothetical protein
MVMTRKFKTLGIALFTPESSRERLFRTHQCLRGRDILLNFVRSDRVQCSMVWVFDRGETRSGKRCLPTRLKIARDFCCRAVGCRAALSFEISAMSVPADLIQPLRPAREFRR